MSKISVDIEYIKSGLQKIGYEISDCIERENNGKQRRPDVHFALSSTVNVLFLSVLAIPSG